MRAAALAVLLAGVSGPGAAAQALPSVSLPADVERVLRDYERGWETGDEDALAALFTEDGFVLSPGHPHVRGRDAIRERYRDSQSRLRLRAVAFERSGDLAWIVGAYDHGEPPDRGKFVLLLRRVEDRWLIAADMDNHIGV